MKRVDDLFTKPLLSSSLIPLQLLASEHLSPNIAYKTSPKAKKNRDLLPAYRLLRHLITTWQFPVFAEEHREKSRLFAHSAFAFVGVN